MIIIKSKEKIESGNIERLAVDVGEAARMLGVSPRTLWTWKKIGKVTFVKIGRRVLYPIDGLRKLVNGGIPDAVENSFVAKSKAPVGSSETDVVLENFNRYENN